MATKKIRCVFFNPNHKARKAGHTENELHMIGYDTWLRSVSREERAQSFRSLYLTTEHIEIPEDTLKQWLDQYESGE